MSKIINHENYQHAIDLVFFEQWLRFYFIAEEGGKLYIRMPESEFAKVKSLYPQLFSIAEALNNREINHQAALESLCEGMLDGPYALTGEQWGEILAGKDFRLMLQLLSFWVQADEEKLDAEIMSFHDWKQRFLTWRESPSIKDYAARFLMGNESEPSTLQ